MSQISALNFQYFCSLLTFRQPANCRRLLLIVENDRSLTRSLGIFESLQWLQKMRGEKREKINYWTFFHVIFWLCRKKQPESWEKLVWGLFEKSGKIIAQINYFNGRRFVCTTQENTKKSQITSSHGCCRQICQFFTRRCVLIFPVSDNFANACELCNSLDCAKFSILIGDCTTETRDKFINVLLLFFMTSRARYHE